jgi:hypothetical protein
MRLLNRLADTIKAQNQQYALVARWAIEPGVAGNWGDKLNPFLIGKLSSSRVFHESQVFSRYVPAVYWVIGSALGRVRALNSVIWGAGFLFENEQMSLPPKAVLAVRGHLSAAKLKKQGLIERDVAIGDPALLMPLLYQPVPSPAAEIGIIPHFREWDLPLVQALRREKMFKVIDVCSGLQAFCDEICSCRQILSSSLHGLVAAHAYGIPARRLCLSDRPKGDGFKYYDYLSSVCRHDAEAIKAETVADVFKRAGRSTDIAKLPNLSALLDACPFITPVLLADLKSKIAHVYDGRC